MNKASSMGIGLLAGLVVGAALGLLFAPKSGSETRAMLKEKAEVVREKAGETVSRMKARAMRAAKGMEPADAE